jgi:hypothetical protein
MRRARLIALAAVVLLLTGCSTIPESGPVQRGPTEAADDSNIVFVANPPMPGATKQQIVAGFLTAASEGGGFTVARQYLTSQAAATWKPRSRVLVQREQPTVTATSATSLSLRVPIAAEVSADGAYTPTTKSVPLDFQLVQRGGQWRIAAAQDGIVLGQTVFQRAYTPKPLQFFDPSYSRLVPDPRWFPVQTNRSDSSAPRPATIVRALIAGPSGPLAGGVTKNALEGAELTSVQVSADDVTTVALTVPHRDPGIEQTSRIEQQLAQSLVLPTPSALHLLLNGRDAPQATPIVEQQTPLAASYVVSGDRFGTLSPAGRFTEDRIFGKSIVAADPQAITVSVHQKLAAVLTNGGQVKAVTPTGTRVVDQRTSVVDPSLDQQGWIYFVPQDAPGSLVAVKGKGKAVTVEPDLGGSTVQSIEVSPDGARMLVLVLVGSARRPQAYVAGIERSADGTPTGLTSARYVVALGGGDGTGIDATWVDDSRVAALVRSADDSTERVWVQPLGNVGIQQGQLANATSISGATSTSDLRVLLQGGAIWTWANNTWQAESATRVDVSVLAVQR